MTFVVDIKLPKSGEEEDSDIFIADIDEYVTTNSTEVDSVASNNDSSTISSSLMADLDQGNHNRA